MDYENFQLEQIGGGRRSPSPVVQTPTRLRRVVKATPRASGAVRRANERRARMQSPSGMAHTPDVSLLTVTRALPAIPHSLDQPSVFAGDINAHRSHIVPASRAGSVIRDVPEQEVLLERQFSEVSGSSRSDAIVTREASPHLPPSRQPTPVYLSGSSVQASFRPSGVIVTREASYPLPSRHPSPAYRQHSAPPPAGPRAPSVPPSRPPSTVPDDGATPITVRPIVKLIPPTPNTVQPVSKRSVVPEPPDDLPSASSTSLEQDEPLPEIDHRSPPSTPTGGRRSGQTNRILEEGYRELEAVLERVALETNMTLLQVAETWHKNAGRVINVPNHWNIYQAYFKAHEEVERARLSSPAPGQATPTVISRCYKRFVDEENENWKEILETFEFVELTKTHEHTLSQRTHSFNAIRRKLCHIVDAAAAKHGFEAAFVMCGNIVNEDASLGYAHTTPGAVEFWETRCKADPDTIIGHLKAHVYNVTSLAVVDEAFNEEANDSGGGIHPSSRDTSQPVQHASAGAEYLDVPHHAWDDESDDYSDLSAALKTLFIELVKACGVETSKLQGSNFPWKTLLVFLASKGLVIEGYPHDILMPGQRRNLAARTKGINDLSLPDKRQLIASIKSRKLTIRKVRDVHEHRAIQCNTSPVVIEEAPPASAPEACGRRMFGNGSMDRKGPSRLAPSVAATRVKKRRAPVRVPTSESSEVEILESHPEVELVTGPSREAAGQRERKRKASAEHGKRATKKRVVDDEDRPVAKEVNRGKMKARASTARGGPRAKKVVSKEFVSLSDEEDLPAVKEAVTPSDGSPSDLGSTANENTSDEVQSARPRPRPRLVKRAPPSSRSEDPFQGADAPADDTERVVAATLQKPVKGPSKPIITPSSPSPKRLNASRPPPVASSRHVSPSPNTLQTQRASTENPTTVLASSLLPAASELTTTTSLRPNTIPPGMSHDPPYAAQGGFPDRMRPPYPAQNNGYYQPMVYGQQQGYPGDTGLNSFGFDPRQASYPDMVGMRAYREGLGYPREMRDPYNFVPGYGLPRDGLGGYNLGFQPMQMMSGESQEALPHLPAPPNA